MGSGQSGLVGSPAPAGQGLGELPESCAAMILARLSPPDICKFAGLNKTFHRASSADFVWQTKLPANYDLLVRKLFDESPSRVSNKEIYSWFSKPIRFHAGTKEIWLERNSGKMCMAISWKGLRITGIDDCRYWSHIPTQQSRFNAIAYLKKVWWLEVGGEVELHFPTGKYSIFFRLQVGKPSRIFGRRICSTDQVHGWDIKPVSFQLSASNGQRCVTQSYLKLVGNWVCYHVGDFTIENHNMPMSIKFSMTQIDCTHSKGGLCLDSVFICPCESAHEVISHTQFL